MILLLFQVAEVLIALLFAVPGAMWFGGWAHKRLLESGATGGKAAVHLVLYVCLYLAILYSSMTGVNQIFKKVLGYLA